MTHHCLYFDDGNGVELLCECGSVAVWIREDADGEAVLVALDVEPEELRQTA
ncbi:hypothetical protein [Cellulomonas denverensis]|uniref:Uncharacterized protein n=1 Tax=Cellulomonas denverensis TaxID=264297 RepID=A0A7X6KVN0_9CELL|nr:hypothetical protein [Cellulomonas denverensis]NKY22968.1 hypothetical protein [Cellulomonas denverensis]